LVAALAVLALIAPAAAQANEVTKWNQIAADTARALPPAAGGVPPVISMNMAMTQGAVYDAVNAIERRHRPYLLWTLFDSMASKDAAVATAAYRMLTYAIESVPASIAFGNKGALLAALGAAHTSSLASIPNSTQKTNGIAAGNAAADAMIAARQNDGRFGASAWTPPGNPLAGHWQPFVVAGVPQLDPTPWAGNVQPFLIGSPSRFRTDGPLDLTSAEYAAELNEVKALGAANSSVRTIEQTRIARWWQSPGGPTIMFNEVARHLAEQAGLDILDSARLFGMLDTIAADTAISCWNDKYHFDFWRPWQAVRRADEDGNPATVADPNWSPMIQAPYPDHPSGHLCHDGALTTGLRVYFGTDKIEYDLTSLNPVEGMPATRHFTRFTEPLGELVEARIWAGLHFRTADIQARNLGKHIAHFGETHYFQPIR
jgi:hypothetical protein